jgi:hypothetical protein
MHSIQLPITRRHLHDERTKGRADMKFQQAMKNPNALFASPEALEVSMEFTASQKTAILRQWKDQLTQLLVADEEGMTRSDSKARANPGGNADCLTRISDVMERISG